MRRWLKTPACVLLLVPLLAAGTGCRGEGRTAGTAAREEVGTVDTTTLSLVSPAFAPGDTIPARFTCDGEDISPPLRWGPVPPGTATWVLVCDDPDAPRGTWQHWLLVNLPAETTSLDAGEGNGPDTLPAGAVLGVNSWGRRAYGGPCPPPGRSHRYFFRLFALSEPVPVEGDDLDRTALDAALAGRVLARAELMGTYRR